ncbi:MAG: zf-HC2 domain-containing protein [Peptostreptococcaceae bacterium]
MSKIDCSVVKDLLPLYIDDLVSEESKLIIKEHLKTCEECSKYLKRMDEDAHIEVKIEKNDLDISGEKIVKEIKKSQDRIKYTLIIFSMIVAVSNSWLSKGLMSTIPLIIITPFVLSLFFKEGKIILLTSVCIHFVLALATSNLELGIVSTPFVIIGVLSGILLGKVIKNMKVGE